MSILVFHTTPNLLCCSNIILLPHHNPNGWQWTEISDAESFKFAMNELPYHEPSGRVRLIYFQYVKKTTLRGTVVYHTLCSRDQAAYHVNICCTVPVNSPEICRRQVHATWLNRIQVATHIEYSIFITNIQKEQRQQ